MTAANYEPHTHADSLIERLTALLEDANAVRRQLEDPRDPDESPSANAERILYFALTTAMEAGLTRLVEDLLKVLRQATQPCGPTGVDWLARQERAWNREEA